VLDSCAEEVGIAVLDSWAEVGMAELDCCAEEVGRAVLDS
jgi:hypothetical protein